MESKKRADSSLVVGISNRLQNTNTNTANITGQVQVLLQMFEAALAGEISYGQNMSVPRVMGTNG